MDVFALLHIVTAVFIVGPMAILPHSGLAALRRGDAKSVRGVERSTAIFSFLSLLVFILGFGALAMSKNPNFNFSNGWLIWSMVLYIVAFALTLFLVLPSLRRGSELIDAGEDAAGAGYGKLAAANGITTLLLVLTVVFMVLMVQTGY